MQDLTRRQITPQEKGRSNKVKTHHSLHIDADANCLICDGPKDGQVIQCDHCDGWVCRQCLPKKYTDKEFKFLTQPEISWNCPSCVDEKQAFGNSKSTSLSNTLTTFMSKMDKGMPLLLNQVGLKADKSDLDELQQKLETTNTVLAEVRGEVATLKKQRNKTTEHTLSMTIAELSYREDRRLNAIMFNVTEVENADSDERIHEDTAKATAILEDIGMSTEIRETRRLGKYNATNENPRPLRITVPTLSDKMRLMRNAPKLKNSRYPHMKLIKKNKEGHDTNGKGRRPKAEAGMGRKKGGIHEVGGPPSQVDPAKRKSCKRGDVQTPRKATESGTGGRRPVSVTGKCVCGPTTEHLH